MTPEEEQVLMHLGAALIFVQGAERMMNFVLRFCFPAAGFTSPDTYESVAAELRKKTLGQFIGILRSRVDLDESFDVALTNFLENRNTLVHRVEDIPGWDLHTSEGCAHALRFIDNFIHSTNKVTFVFAGLARAWADENQMNDLTPTNAVLEEIDTKYRPLADQLFFSKS